MSQLKYILFDLDGTLLPMDQDQFINSYLTRLAAFAAKRGYDPKDTVRALWSGTEQMVKNDGARTNKQVFWENFEHFFPGRSEQADKSFESFYSGDFQNVSAVCSPSPIPSQICRLLKERGLTAVLATNPVFPKVATESRIRWAGLEKSDFVLVTSYENSHYCKPNPNYYSEILKKLGAHPSECLMVGNDTAEDMIAKKLGMEVFLLTNCLINKHNEDINSYPNGDFDALMSFLKERTDK